MKRVLFLLVLANLLILPADVFCQGYDIGGVYDVLGTNSNGTIYKGKVTITKSGNEYNFLWKVGSTYTGKGYLEGSILTVDWGDKYPVIYEVREGGRVLVGTWGNGTAAETCCKQGSEDNNLTVEGEYNVLGTNPDGTVYRGTVNITKSGDDYLFAWNVGNLYSGKGTLRGDELRVKWDDFFPVIYKVREGGRLLMGTWKNGRATEVLYK